jgi:hypothetical protein
MGPALIPAQIAALEAIHAQLAALTDASGKGGPPTTALVVAINADLLAFYQSLLGIKTGK